MLETTRTYTCKINNHSQVKQHLDKCGFSASKIWNVGRYYIEQQWNKTGEIPNEKELKNHVKNHERYKDLHSQSSQKVLEELSEAFQSWYNSNNPNDNPPGYRKHGDNHPRSTITWKKTAIKHDDKHNQIKLSKGTNHKENSKDYLLIEYQSRPDVKIENITQARAVWKNNKWQIHLVCKKKIPTEKTSNKTAGIDLGINNFATVSLGEKTLLYPGNKLKEDNYYFEKQKAKCDKPNSTKRNRLDHKRTERRKHYLHSVSKHIIQKCKQHNIGKIAIGNLKGIRNQNWGDKGNLKLNSWAFDKFTRMLEYKADEQGILVERISEKNTSKKCCSCGVKDNSNRIERGLYSCSNCGLTANADCNGAENIRSKVTPTPSRDRSNGCLAQPDVYLFDTTVGITPQEQDGLQTLNSQTSGVTPPSGG